MPARKISFVNFKGGVGKTTLAVNVAAALADRFRRRVIVIDCDPQASASLWLLGDLRWKNLPAAQKLSAVLGGQSVFQAIIKAPVRNERGEALVPNLDLLAGDYSLDRIEWSRAPEAYMKMYETIKTIEGEYEYIILDCAPADLPVTRLAIFASQEIIVPCNPDEFSRVGLFRLDEKLKDLATETDAISNRLQGFRFPSVRGVILNDLRSRSHYESEGEIEDAIKTLKRNGNGFHNSVFTLKVHQSIEIPRAITVNLPLVLQKGSAKEEVIALAKHIESIGELP